MFGWLDGDISPDLSLASVAERVFASIDPSSPHLFPLSAFRDHTFVLSFFCAFARHEQLSYPSPRGTIMDLERCWIVAYRAWGCAVARMDMQVYGYAARRQTGIVHVPS